MLNAESSIHQSDVDFMINTDARESGWGATDEKNSTGRVWADIDRERQISYLELKVIFLAFKEHNKFWAGCTQIRVKSDNTTALAYVNNIGV